MRLYSGPLSMFGAKVEIALLEKGLAYERVMVPFDSQDRYLPKHPEVLRVNPKQQVPVLIDGPVELFDSTQIFEYLEDAYPSPPLWPADIAGRARARQLEHRSDEVFFAPVIRLMGLEDRPDDPAAVAAREQIWSQYRETERSLAAHGSPFLAGDFTYADIAFYMAQLFAARKTAPMRSETPLLLAWRERVGTRAAIRQPVLEMAAFLRANNRAVPNFVDALKR